MWSLASDVIESTTLDINSDVRCFLRESAAKYCLCSPIIRFKIMELYLFICLFVGAMIPWFKHWSGLSRIDGGKMKSIRSFFSVVQERNERLMSGPAPSPIALMYSA